MRTRLPLLIIATAIIAALAVQNITAQSRRSVWSGVYTEAQAERGKAAYERTCIRCHAASLDGIQDATLLGDFGPRFSMRGNDFMERWREDTAYSLYHLIKVGMPPRNEPGAQVVDVSDETAIDLMAFIFKGNGFPAGDTEITASNVRSIRIQGKDGSKPLPSFSIVQVVGCFTQFTPGNWQLSTASEPTRIRELAKPTEEDIIASDAEPRGNQSFDLQNLGFLGKDFDAIQYQGRKMQARGVLIRQPPNVRIDVRSFVEVSPTCEP